MALRVFLSNDLARLGDGLATNLAAAPLDPLESEIVLVQSQGMRRWLVQHLARRLGCAASLSTPFPERFCAELGLARPGEGARDDLWSAEALGLRLLDLLDEVLGETALAPVAAYLRGSDLRMRLTFCRRLGRCFEQYQTTRPDWLLAWEENRELGPAPHAPWQAILWRCLVRDGGGDHPARRLAKLTRRLHAGDCDIELPSRLHVFACGSLPPAVMDLLAGIAKHRPLGIWQPSPTPMWWGDLRSERELARARGISPEAEIHSEVGNPLLASLARQGRDHLVLLASRDDSGQALVDIGHEEPSGQRLLDVLRSDVLHVVDRGRDDVAPVPLADDDRSLSCHVCHSPVRELEVVRDLLLQALADDPTLTPADCCVLLADPDDYAPLARTVLQTLRQGQRLPVRVAERGRVAGDEASEALLALLRLASARASASDLLDLLERPILRVATEISEAALPHLRRCIERAGVHWGLDTERRAQRHTLPNFPGHSWRDGLDRLLIGLATGPSDDLIHGVLPLGGESAADDVLIGRCAVWIDRMARLTDALAGEYTLADWVLRLRPWIADCFDQDHDAVPGLLQHLERLERMATNTDSSTTLPIGAVIDVLTDVLAEREGGAAFLWGGITVAALKPMRSLPFRVVAVCGLDDSRFPRRDRAPAFDLAAAEPRVGDRRARDEDRQLFLDTLLSTRDRLILTWTGFSASDGAEQPPATCVAEVLDWCDRAVTPSQGMARDHVVVAHPLQPFSPRYAEDPRLVSYGPLLHATHHAAPEFAPTRLEPQALPTIIDWLDLARAWADPSAWFLEQRLQAVAHREDNDPDDSEPMDLDGLAQWEVRDQMIRRRLADDPDPTAWVRAAGLLPVGPLGEARAISWLGDADAIVARLDGEALASRTIAIAFPTITIAGQLDQRSSNGIQRWTAGAASSKHRLALWVAHLLAQLDAEQRGESPLSSRLIHREGTVILAPVDDARARLADLIDGLQHFLCTPVPLFPAASYAWIERDQKLRAGSTRAKKSPEDMARDEWSKDLSSWAIERCWSDHDAIAHPDFIPWARRLWEPIFLATEGE